MAVGYLETTTNEDRRQALARDYFTSVSGKVAEYRDRRAGEWVATADWLYSHANDVYYDTQRYTKGQTNDPREFASRKMFIDSFREQCGGISEDWLERNYKGIIKSATGADIDATGLFEVFGNKVVEGYKSFGAGVASIAFEIENMLNSNSSDDYDDKKRKERQDKFLSSIAGTVRTDYFNEYDSFVQKAILGLGDTLPSLLNSAPAFIGAVVSGFTGNPLALGAGRAISSALNFTMEYGSLVQSLRNSGATPEQILLTAGAYAGISTAIEYNFDKIPQNLLAKPMGQWLRLYKEVDGLGPKVIADSVAKVLGRRVLTAGADWLSETGEEMLQQLAEDWTVNLLSKYRETHGQSALPEWLTATSEEMWNDFLETGKQMGTTQTLLSVGEMLLGLGFDVSLGNIRHITKASRGVEKTKNSILVPTKSVSINSKASAFYPITAEDGKEQPFSPARVLRRGNEYIPASSDDMSKAMYQSNNGQFMYVDVADDIETSAYENRTIDEAKNVINGLIDENNGHRVSYAYNTDGSIVVDAGDLDAVVSDYIKSNIDSVIGTQETDNGIVVTVDGKNTVFTTEEHSGAKEFSQDEHLHGIIEKIKNAKSEQEANEAKDLLDRANEIRERRAEETARNVSEDTKNYRNAVNDTVNSLYKTKEERKAERDNYKAQEAKIRQTVSETFDNAMKDGKNAGLLKNVTRKKAIDTWTRGSVIVMARLAKAMGKSVSEFGNRINFVYNPEFVQEGKARMGWTEANADGTYTINLTKLADQSTAIHEIGHAFLYMLGSDGYKSIKGFEEAFKDALGKDGGKIGDATHEAFAEALENYVNQNVASNEGIRSVFNSILNALRNFVDAVRDVITQEQIEMFDNLFEKGLNEGWTESDEVNEGKQFKTASSYYYDNQVSRNSRTEEGNKADRKISDGLIASLKSAYLNAVKAEYNEDGVIELYFDSSDALSDFLEFMRTTESKMLAKESEDGNLDNNATTRFALFLPHGNIQLIDVFENSDTEEILESINDVIDSRRAEGFSQTYADKADNGEPVRTLVDLYDMYADDYTKNWTRLLHASPELFDEFVVFKDKVTLGKKWGYGIYHFDNPQASISVMKDILNQDNSEKGYVYSTAVNTGDESKFIHATGDRSELGEYGAGAGVTQEQRNMLDTYAIRKHKTSLNSLMMSFVESDTEDYRNVNGLSWYDIYDKLNEQNDWVDDAQECMDKAYDACVDLIKGKDVSGLSFFYMVQVLFGEDNLMWDARKALSDAGFKGMIIYEDFWGNSASKNTDEYGGIIDPETGIRQLPTEIVIFNPADEVDLQVQIKSAESVNEEVSRDTDKVTADSYMKQQRKYKTAWTEDEIKNTLEGGKFVPNSVLSKNKDSKYVKVERVAQNIIATQPKMYELAKEAIDEYLMGINKTFGELSDAELEEVAELWNKKVKEINSDFDIEKSDNMNLLMKRLNAYANDESPERTTSQWLSRYTNIRNGRSNIQQLAVQMQEAGLFNDKVDVDGEKLSSKYTSLNYIADKVGKSKSKNNKRVYIDSFVYENALKEILNNSDDIMSSLGLDTEFAKGDIVEEIESSENYTENRSIKKLLELDLDDEVRDVIQNGRWNGTVASDLAKKYQQQINQRNLQNKTIQELRERRDSLKEKLKEYREKNETLEKENRYMKALEREIARLDDDVVTLTSAYATKKMELELYRTRQQIIKAINSKSGDAVTRNNIKGAVRTILGTTRKDVSKGKIAYISDEALASMPNVKNFLENNGYLIANKLTAGVDDMTSAELSMFKNAVREDRKLSRIEQEKKEADFNEKILSDVNRIVGTMSSSSVAKLTKEDDSKINEVYASLEGGRENLSDTEKANLRQEARSRVLSAKIESILRNKKYGTEETSKKNRRRGTFGDDFTTFSRILRNVSPELYKIVMEDGLNVVTDNKYKMFDERYGRFIDNMKKITKLKSDKDVSKYLKKIMSLQDKLDVIGDRPIDSRLMKSEYFKEILEEDIDRKSAKSDTKYTLQEMFAIYEHSFDEGGLKHLHDGNNITAYEIAWVVDQFENGKYQEYKPVAHEMRRVYGERFPQIYDTVLENENRELKQVDAYSAQMGLDFDSDLSMRFGYVYDDKVTQKKSFTKDRQFGSNKISLNYYSDLRKVIEMQEGYIAGASFFREMDRLFDSRGGNLKNIITEMYDERTSDRIEQMLDICKNDVVVGNRMTEADGLVSTVRNHYVMARLAYNFSSVLQQLASWGLGFTKYGVGRMWKTTMQFLMHPIKMNNLVYELSPQMKRNVNPLLEMAKETMSKNPDSVAGKINDALSSVGSKGLVLMEKLDHIVRNTLWYVSYQAELDELYSEKKTKELSASDLDLAQRRATQWVMDIQSSSQAKDNALVYAKGDAIWKQLLMFTNQLNKEWNVLWNDAIKNGLLKRDIGKFFANFAGLSIATMWVVLSTGKLKNNEDDDETWIEDLLQDFGTEFISRAPVIGQTAKNALEGFTYEQTDDPITRTIELVKKLAEGDSDKTKTAVRNEVWSFLDIFGAPTTAVKRTYRTFEGGDFLQGDHIMRMLGGEWYKYFE